MQRSLAVNTLTYSNKMAPYDSDDSLDDDQEYTETDVLLGYASKDPNGETVSKLGGQPVRGSLAVHRSSATRTCSAND